MKTGNFSSYISKVKRSLHFLLFTVRDFWDWKPFVWMLPLSLSRVRAVFRLVAPSSPWRASLSVCNLIPSRRIYTRCYNPLSSLVWLFFFLSILSHRLGSLIVSLIRSLVLFAVVCLLSCLAAAPSKTQRPFSDVVPLSLSLSIEPVSPSKPCWKLCCSILLLFWYLISWYCSVHVVYVCVGVYPD